MYNFDTTYTNLSAGCYQLVDKPKIKGSQIILLNQELTKKLGIMFTKDPLELLGPAQEKAFAQAYAGHQFGHFTMLGDGRAMILGEHITPSKERFDIQLKGSGRTAFSRGGDGKATMSSMLREYLYSYAMNALKVPSSESLAIISTNEPVFREDVFDGAILFRVMQSHIRFGTFEYVSRYSPQDLQEFADYTINRHYPKLSNEDDKYVKFLDQVVENTIDKVVNWYRVGFVHGVMNTDNMSIIGETFDYGPCAFMNRYKPSTTFSQIDTYRRYSFENQKNIAKWNLSVLGKVLLPLFDSGTVNAHQLLIDKLQEIDALFENKYYAMMNNKLGIATQADAKDLIHTFLGFLEENSLDYTNAFVELMHPGSFEEYQTEEFEKLREEIGKVGGGVKLMKENNPQRILRNYLVEEALDAYEISGNIDKVKDLLAALAAPYEKEDSLNKFQQPPSKQFDSTYSTHCNT